MNENLKKIFQAMCCLLQAWHFTKRFERCMTVYAMMMVTIATSTVMAMGVGTFETSANSAKK
jgi:hypothetical protein